MDFEFWSYIYILNIFWLKMPTRISVPINANKIGSNRSQTFDNILNTGLWSPHPSLRHFIPATNDIVTVAKPIQSGRWWFQPMRASDFRQWPIRGLEIINSSHSTSGSVIVNKMSSEQSHESTAEDNQSSEKYSVIMFPLCWMKKMFILINT